MSSLIFFIFMIWFIMRIVKNKQKATGQNDPKQTQGSSPSRLGNSTFGSDGSSSSSTSTTAYLERKAKEDARDHAQEKREEQARLHQETGGRMVGVRYYEWDSIPKGNRVVKCSYCGAENLISERYKPNRYTCYFCREILE